MIESRVNSEVGNIDVGEVRIIFRVGDLARQMQDMSSRLRAEIRHTLGYLGREAQGRMMAAVPVRRGGLRQSIRMLFREEDTVSKVTIRPGGSRRIYLQAAAVEVGIEGPVKQHVRRPVRASGLRRASHASKKWRSKAVREGIALVRVQAYQRKQPVRPFVRPVFEAMRANAEAALQNAAVRAARGS